MIETAHIDIKAVIEQLCSIAWKGKHGQGKKAAYKGGPCPFCHVGTDRFAVFTEDEKPHFYCGIHGNGCGAHGDVITFVQQIKGYTTAGQAIHELREMGYPVGDETRAAGYKPSSERDRPNQKWQDRGNALIHAAQKCLWSSKGKQTLDYLRTRGLQDEIIKRFRIGYCPDWSECQYSEWGIESEGTFWLRPSILIPCYEDSAKDVLWGINRRLTAYTEKELERQRQGEKLPPRYMQIKGSSNGLFNVENIRPGEPLFMTEGEIDAMTLVQTGYPSVATGSTKGAQLSRWIASLSLASHLIIAFDDDQGKGEKAAEYWTNLFEDKAMFYPPWSKDVNDMLQQGQDIKLWASMGMEITGISTQEPVIPVASTGDTTNHPPGVGVPGRYQASTSTPDLATLPLVTPYVPEPVQDQTDQKQTKSRPDESELPRDLDQCAPLPEPDAPDCLPELPDVCTICGGEVAWYSDDQRPWCADHSPDDSPTPTLDAVVKEVTRLFGAQVVEIRPRTEWTDEYKTTLLQQRRDSLVKPMERSRIQQMLVKYWVDHGEMPDYRAIQRMVLEPTGYYEAFAATEQALLNRVSTPRVYPCPVPRYELQEDDHGVKHLVTVGYWTEQNQEVAS